MKIGHQGLWGTASATSILRWASLACLALGSLGLGSARASTTSGNTIIFQDLTDNTVVSEIDVSGGGRSQCNGFSERHNCFLTAPIGLVFASSTLISTGDLNILEPGKTDNISDQIIFYTPGFQTVVSINFVSDGDPGFVPGTGNCANLLVICVTEDGTVQTAGTITWSNGTDCSDPATTCIVDTIKFQSDLDTQSTTPEPGTLVLLGSGLVSLVSFARRKIIQT